MTSFDDRQDKRKALSENPEQLGLTVKKYGRIEIILDNIKSLLSTFDGPDMAEEIKKLTKKLKEQTKVRKNEVKYHNALKNEYNTTKDTNRQKEICLILYGLPEPTHLEWRSARTNEWK